MQNRHCGKSEGKVSRPSAEYVLSKGVAIHGNGHRFLLTLCKQICFYLIWNVKGLNVVSHSIKYTNNKMHGVNICYLTIKLG